MKRISYVLLISAAFVSCVSCNKDINKVSASEFNQAFEFEGVEYLQVEGLSKGASASYEFAPNVYHENRPDESEFYITKKDDFHFTGIERYFNSGDQSWKKISEEEAEGRFQTPTTFCEEFKTIVCKLIGYKKFKYDSETKKYSCTYHAKEEDYYIILAFENARLISYDATIGDLSTYTFTYEETPIEPPIVNK